MEYQPLEKNDFVHLHLHSDYSLLQSTIQLKRLAERLKTLGMKACAITDKGNMFGAASFYREMKYAGIKPIIGYEASVVPGSRFDKSLALEAGELAYYELVLLAKNYQGYLNLSYIASKAFTEGANNGKARVDIELLGEKSSDLFVLTGAPGSALWHYVSSGDIDRAERHIATLTEIYGSANIYVQIEDHGIPEDVATREQVMAVANKASLPLVATNNVFYLEQEDAKAQEVLLSIGAGTTLNDPGRPSLPNDSYYLKSTQEMRDLFAESFPEALSNTVKIAGQCDVVLPIGGDLTLPTFPIPAESGCSTIEEYFEKVVRAGLERRKIEVLIPSRDAGELKYPLEKYDERLQLEIDTIEGMGYPGYFLIVWDFIRYAMEHKIPVGPGRGSAAGSLVAYALEITDVDPLQYDLFFERFLNPERVSMPDIDIDFCIRGRGEVINHVVQLYGRESVCQIITFGTMASKAAIKDVGRALNMPYGDVERVAKMIPPPFRGRITSISKALEDVPELKAAQKSDPKVAELLELALRIEGCSRHSSVHAAGVVISPKPLHEMVPIAISAKNELTSQYPMGDLEKLGMLKMDFLGLTTLTIISDCLAGLRERTGKKVEWKTVSLRDEKTMKIFGDGKTEAVFQFESSGMQEICRRLKPKELEDLAALNALYRPGPLDGGMVEDFIKRHRGEKEVTYILPEMEDILKNTFGVLVYQEQIMQIAQRLAGYSLGEADLMRRAMGKKKPEEMAPHEVKFIGGAVERGIKEKTAREIFDLMAKFADYGFNRSHSIAYAMLAFQTAYLKAHYPAYFYAAVLSHESDNSSKVYKYSSELRSMGLRLLPPDVNESDEGFTPTDDSVRFGLSAIKGLGASSASAIIEARGSEKFKSIFDFVSRVGQNGVNRKMLESLIAGGAFDSMIPDGVEANAWRSRLFTSINDILAYGQSSWNDKLQGQTGLFAAAGEGSTLEVDLAEAAPWTREEMAAREKAALGFYLSVHPLDAYDTRVDRIGVTSIDALGEAGIGDMVSIAGIVSGLLVRWSKSGNRYAQFRLEDRAGNVKILVWSETYTRIANMLADDALLIVDGKIENNDGGEITIVAAEARSLPDVISRQARNLVVTLPKSALDEELMNDLYALLASDRGMCDVTLILPIDGFDLTLKAPALQVQGSRKLEEQLRSLGCAVTWNH
ncbi:MAG: DNA polymerase III subunit alpha [Acidobacteria bacterium]|nr:DNA polymerase III subunit alpha [Acidobacteriota bacterium]